MAKKATAQQAVSGGTYDVEAARAKAVATLNDYVEVIGSAERMAIGTWYQLPEGTEGWHIVRCGDPGTSSALALQAKLKRMGYQTAAPQVRCKGFEEYDGDHGVYVWAPPEVYQSLRERKARAQAEINRNLRESFGGTLGGLLNTPGAEVSVSGRTGRGSADDVKAAMRDVGRG